MTAGLSVALAGRRVAITRAEPGALGPYLEGAGLTVVHVPFIAVGPPPDPPALARALARLASFDWLVVTSASGARAVGAAAAAEPGVRLAAVGPATAIALGAAAGRPADLVAAVPRVEGLLAEFPAGPRRVLVAQADRAASTLRDGLAAAGHDVESVVAYATVTRQPPPSELRRLDKVDAVVFASGSAVEAWVGVRGSSVPPVVVAVGPVTDRAARALGVTPTAVAASPGPEGVGAALVAAFGRLPPAP